jgi:NADH-quinone oxidoreductase subunit N
MYVIDGLALFFKRFFLVAAIIVTLMTVEFSDRIESGISEFYSLITFALMGMMFAASANDFTMLFVAMELITVSFYILTSFQRRRLISLEAGVKYLILGALASAFLVYGIALVYGTAGTMKFAVLAGRASAFTGNPLFLLGLLLIVMGSASRLPRSRCKSGRRTFTRGAGPSTAFLAVGSKAAGFILLWRVLFFAVPQVTVQWTNLLIVVSAITILYGNLCALPQRNIKRLFGYSSIAHAGYLLLGVAAMACGCEERAAGGSAILYLPQRLSFYRARRVPGPLPHIAPRRRRRHLVSRRLEPAIAAPRGSHDLAMVSLAGIPPLAGFFGKFLLLKAALDHGAANHGFYCLVGVAIVGVVISLYYYFGVVRAIYWSASPVDASPVKVPVIQRALLYICAAGNALSGTFSKLARKPRYSNSTGAGAGETDRSAAQHLANNGSRPAPSASPLDITHIPPALLCASRPYPSYYS